jgi:hypothetical protein
LVELMDLAIEGGCDPAGTSEIECDRPVQENPASVSRTIAWTPQAQAFH